MTGIAKLRAELRAGLDGVTPGPWGWPGNDLQAVGSEMTVVRTWATPLRYDRAHIARCSPDNIRALLDALDAAERERDEARAKALDDVRKMIFAEISPQSVAEGDWCSEAVEMAQYLAAKVALMKDRAP